ncbi:MAG: sensor histidine kinase [Lachnospiraceae bacterium]|nr:sensor histidine kinase [Lachnospiraceae bacterium]
MADFDYWSEWITRIVSMIELCIDGYCLYRFVRPFLRRAKAALAAGGGYFLTMLAVEVLPLYVDAFIAYALGSLTVFLVMYRLERRNGTQKAFLAITFFSLRWFTATIAELLYDKLYDLVENTPWYQGNPSMSMQLMVYVGVCVFYLIMVFLITTATVCCITRSYICKYEQMTKRELLMLVSPPFLGAVGYKVIRYYRRFYILENGKPAEVYDMLLLFYCGLAIVVVAILIMLYQNIKAAQEEKTANQLLSTQIDDLKRHIGQVENLYQGIRSMKHDMTNHILTLERLYAGNNVEEALDYGKELKSALSPIEGEIKTGNPVTDVILQELKSEAEKKSIHFQSNFYYPTGTGINAFDVSVILNNALQNAMENAGESKTPHISVLSYHRNNAYMIEVSNSFTGNLKWDEERGLPVTSKEKKDGHGYGLSNIRMVARKYSGDIAIDLKDDEFRLSIMLMME